MRRFGEGRREPNPSLQPAWPARPEAPCAWGDLFDRLSILELKCARVTGAAALVHVRGERDAVAEVVGDRARFPAALDPLLSELTTVNASLWDIEDRIRTHERTSDFGPAFVTLARGVYTENDRRAAIKRRINLLLGSALVEEKHFTAAPAVDAASTAG